MLLLGFNSELAILSKYLVTISSYFVQLVVRISIWLSLSNMIYSLIGVIACLILVIIAIAMAN